MKDIAPELLEKIKKDFEKKLKKSETIKAFREKVKKKTATYKDANDFAIETGELLADAFQSNLSKEILPKGKSGNGKRNSLRTCREVVRGNRRRNEERRGSFF